jgi:GT2 family glycosyltransferase
MDLSVIIVNYNVRQFLENALTSIKRAMEGMDGEIIVVDNASDDGSTEMVRTKFPDVVLLENPRNEGFARANNTGLRRARGRNFLLINPDTIVQEDTLRVMLRFFDETPDAGLAGCKILNPDGSFQLPCRRSFPTPWVAFTKIAGLSALFPRSRLFGRYNLTYLNPDETYPVEAVSGSFMMMRREAYERVGGLDETFFMYGEDLDLCYRVARAGFRVYYVASTKIVHFKGESTRRSDIDEVRHFYEAMEIFVEKHFSHSALVKFLLTLGIEIRAAMAFLARAGRILGVALIDFVIVGGTLVAAEYLYFGQLFKFPAYAYPVMWIVPGLVVVVTGTFLGVYSIHRYAPSRAMLAALIGYVLISAAVFFAKTFAFSRAVTVIAGGLSMALLPGWRLGVRFFGRSTRRGSARRSLFGSRTVIVGTGPSAQEVLRKMRAQVDGGFDVCGFIGVTRRQIGERIAGVEVLGSIDNIGKVIGEHHVSDVIFSTDGISYTDILSVIGRSDARGVTFRLVPNSLEAIIGKTSIEQLDTLPLVNVEYNIHKPLHRFGKRLFDIVAAAVILILLSPTLLVRRTGPMREMLRNLPGVFAGRISVVGLPLEGPHVRQDKYLGPRGLTGLVQINAREDLGPEEAERYMLYYAKNQSLVLDCEIILKSLTRVSRR